MSSYISPSLSSHIFNSILYREKNGVFHVFMTTCISKAAYFTNNTGGDCDDSFHSQEDINLASIPIMLGRSDIMCWVFSLVQAAFPSQGWRNAQYQPAAQKRCKCKKLHRIESTTSDQVQYPILYSTLCSRRAQYTPRITIRTQPTTPAPLRLRGISSIQKIYI